MTIGYIPNVRSRHGSHSAVKHNLARFELPSIVRFGSSTPTKDVYPKAEKVVEINTVQAVKNSASKLLMKQCFAKAGVVTADWWIYNIGMSRFMQGETMLTHEQLPFPIVAKHHFGSRGTGNYLLHNPFELQSWMHGKDISKYIFEKFYDYCREYRLHITKDGCFYTCRKMLKHDTPKQQRWFRNDSNSVWILEENPSFDKPTNWTAIVAECVKALQAVGLDIAAFDVRVQSAKDKEERRIDYPKFIILESNSAPSFGDVTAEKYKEMLPSLIKSKI